jgi:nucleotide-binding universal stress UspA family protein
MSLVPKRVEKLTRQVTDLIPGQKGGPMFGRIVVGTDGSDTAAEAVRQATELAKMANSRLDIVSAFEPVPQQRMREESAEIPGDIQHAVNPRSDVNVTLEGAAGAARQAGLEVQTHAREGDPADAILDVAEEVRADLIIVGNKGMTGAKRFLLGSVPNKVSHHAPCGVLIIRTT